MGGDLLSRLPHGLSFRFIDRVIEYEEGKRVVALKNVSVGEPVFEGLGSVGYFLPAPLLLEAMGQVAGLLLPEKSNGYFAAAREIRFINQAKLGDRLVLEAVPLYGLGDLHRFYVKVSIEEKIAVEAEIILGVVEL